MPTFVPEVPFHVQFVFLVTFGYIWVSAFYDSDYNSDTPETDPETGVNEVTKANVWRALISIVLFLSAFSYLDPYIETVQHRFMQRINRVVVQLMIAYLCWLIFMLHMRPKFGRWTLGYLDSTLNKPVTKEMHTYDDNCEFTFANIWDNFDHYYLVHCCNWFLAALVIRDPFILHFWQLLDEGVELSAQHILPHFRECWWDHILMDISLSNIPAICLGLWFIDTVGIRRYDWLGREGANSISEWKVWSCHKRFGALGYQQGLLLIHFLTGFFLNNSFLIRPKHFFPIARLILWFAFGAIAHRESFIDISTWNTEGRKDHPVEGRFRWLSCAVLLTELIVSYKYREGTGNIQDAPTPFYIWFPWFASVVSIVCGWFYLRFKKGHTVKYPGFESQCHTAVKQD